MKWFSFDVACSLLISAVTRCFMEFTVAGLGLIEEAAGYGYVDERKTISVIVMLIKPPHQQRSAPRRAVMQISFEGGAVEKAEEEERAR